MDVPTPCKLIPRRPPLKHLCTEKHQLVAPDAALLLVDDALDLYVNQFRSGVSQKVVEKRLHSSIWHSEKAYQLRNHVQKKLACKRAATKAHDAKMRWRVRVGLA